VWRLLAYPAAFAERLQAAVGPWPGPPDDAELARWWLESEKGVDLDVYLEQIERLDRWLDAVLELVVASEDFRLLLAYHPGPDEYQHSSLVVSPDQWAFSPGRAVAAAEGLKRVGRSVDASVEAAWRTLDPARDVLVVLSDHGLLPIHRLVRLDRLLADAGLLEVAADGRVGAASKVRATTAGATAHVYLNRVGERPGGVVSAAEADGLLARVARLLADLEDQGEPLVERLVTRRDAAALGLGHPATGDLVAFLAPGSAFAPGLEPPVVGPSAYYGQHGYLARHDGMCAMLFARGAGIRRSRPAELAATEVEPLLAALLGLPPR
jgi:predicted AlkP superfamily phosphohydrolase/phosphomutase